MKSMIKTGRCTDGFERGAGRVRHALPDDTPECSHAKALCGTKPGRRSVGWSNNLYYVNCKRCLQKLEAL
jgi:hypothetical protein